MLMLAQHSNALHKWISLLICLLYRQTTNGLGEVNSGSDNNLITDTGNLGQAQHLTVCIFYSPYLTSKQLTTYAYRQNINK